jgi:glycosyltransferase involved in cell wall biosynthesis
MKKSVPLGFAMVNEWLTFRTAQKLLAESRYSAQEARKYAKKTVRMIPHPLREDFLQTDPGGKSKKQIVFLGALNDGKGAKDAVRAFAEADSKDWKLLYIGRGSAEYEQELTCLVQELGVERCVQLCGTLPLGEIIKLFQESPVFLLPTYMDTGPTSLKEALAMGLWPVCYDNSGPQELIGRYQYGSLSPTGDIPTLAKTLRKTLTEEPWKQTGRTEQCVKQVRHDLCRETVWKQLLEAYTEEFWRGTSSS